MAFDYSKLLGRIREKGLTQRELAEQIGISPTTLSLKLGNNNFFTQKEVLKLCKVLDISDGDVAAYFFAEEVQKS